MTPEQLHAALDARRCERRWALWQLAIALQTGQHQLRMMRRGKASPALRRRCMAWLETGQGAEDRNAQREDYLWLRGQGVSPEAAAARVEIDTRCGRRWEASCG